MRLPTISVLIPSYNYANYLPHTIRSVQNQTFGNIEILIIDDGSTDESWPIIEQMAQEDSRIRAWRQPNAGLIVTLNRLMSKVRCEYIAQIDADDIWLPERLTMGMSDMQANARLSAVFCGYDVIDGQGKFSTHSYHRHLGGATGAILMQNIMVRNCVCACTALMRRRAILQSGGFARNFSLAHDWDRWLRLSLRGPMAINAQVGAMHRWHGANQSSDSATRVMQELAIMKDMAPKIVASYGLDSAVCLRILAQMHALDYKTQSPEHALKKLGERADLKTLTTSEHFLFLLSLFSTGQRNRAVLAIQDLNLAESIFGENQRHVITCLKSQL